MKRFLLGGLCFGLLFAVSGCNLFSWTHVAGSSNDSVSLTADGYAALEQKKWDTAIDYFSRAISLDASNSLARYGRAKARFQKADLNVRALADRFGSGSKPDGQAFLAPQDLKQADWPDALVWLQPIIDDLDRIIEGPSDGAIPANAVDVNLDCAILYIMKGSIYLLDKAVAIRWSASQERYVVDFTGSQIDDPADPMVQTSLVNLYRATNRLDTALKNAKNNLEFGAVRDYLELIEKQIEFWIINPPG
jgi:tetratricopeptide (TPR) repeat protein